MKFNFYKIEKVKQYTSDFGFHNIKFNKNSTFDFEYSLDDQ